MKDNSYTELTKSSARNRGKKNYIQDLYIEMLLLEVLLKAEKEKLIAQIDKALDERDEAKFFELSSQFRELCKRFGT